MKGGMNNLQEEYGELQSGAGQVAQQTTAMNEELHSAKLELKTKEELIDSLKQEQEKRLNESKQFITLKKLIQTKNEQLKVIRTKLEKYEPPE